MVPAIPLARTTPKPSSPCSATLVALLGHLGYPPEPCALPVPRPPSATAAGRRIVAETDGELVGRASIHVRLSIVDDTPDAKLGALVVEEHHRRRGDLARRTELELAAWPTSPGDLSGGSRRPGRPGFAQGFPAPGAVDEAAAAAAKP